MADLVHDEWLAGTNGRGTFPGAPRRRGGHPAPFPEELPRQLIRLLSFVGDTVLDPMMGSGTTVAVAARLGRRAIGFDIAEEYVQLARRRVGGVEGQAA